MVMDAEMAWEVESAPPGIVVGRRGPLLHWLAGAQETYFIEGG